MACSECGTKLYSQNEGWSIIVTTKNDEWKKRRKQIFSNNRLWVEKPAEDSWDMFIGKLRQMEDGQDPHSPDRISYAQEIVAEIEREFRRGSFRDKRDEELFVNWKFGGLISPPDERTAEDISLIDDSKTKFLY